MTDLEIQFAESLFSKLRLEEENEIIDENNGGTNVWEAQSSYLTMFYGNNSQIKLWCHDNGPAHQQKIKSMIDQATSLLINGLPNIVK